MMDGRKQRLGQRTLPRDRARVGHPGRSARSRTIRPSGRDGSAKAASIAAYRETYGYDHPHDPIGPEPTQDTPDQQAAWHEAFLALGLAGQPDVRAMRDGRLWLIRGHPYAAETAWAPPHVGKELRLARLGAASFADRAAIRAAAEADAARKTGDPRARRAARRPGRELPGDARPLPRAREHLHSDHGRPAGVGARH